ncbi:hypothetical protein A3I50_02670 [Candidatus Roizmanbacteria bacterium RIFCSPLOWO2_02_FULL_37_9]|nr:MAG: hypothetical protein A3I50_02670 [Candidatus Roizmanbacteria bacterium RIFCSPLOWO2_02_FULL_37_9]
MKRKTLPEIIIFLIIFLIFFINTTYVTYPDEFVNLLAGKFINSGKIPYKEFFDHHLPFAWYFAAVLLKFSSGSYLLFRYLWSVFSFIVLLSTGLWIRKYYRSIYLYYLIFFAFYPLVSVYFWLHLFLADSLATLFFVLVFWILICQTFDKKISFRIILICSLLTFLLIFSSLTYLYLGLALYLWQFYLVGFRSKRFLILFVIIILPYFLYLIYLLFYKSLDDFYLANIEYNTSLYIDIPNYVRGRFFNPLKFGFTLIFNFWEGFLPRLATVKDLSLYLPISTVTVLGSFILLILFLFRNVLIAAIFFFLVSFSAPRSNLQKAMFETDYQTGLFIMLGIVSSLVAVYLLRKLEIKDTLTNDIRRLSQLLLSILLLFTFVFLVKNTYDKWFYRYTQKMPSIYDKADTAVFLDEVLEEDDYYWIGPYEPHEIFFVKKGRLSGKYISVMPQFKENEKIKRSFIEQFERNQPKIIIFKWNTGVFGTPADQFADFFLEWLKDKYTRLDKIKDIKVLKSPSSFYLNTNLFLLNNHQDEILRSLRINRYIQ